MSNPPKLSLIHILDKNKKLEGEITLKKLLASSDNEVIENIMDKNICLLYTSRCV